MPSNILDLSSFFVRQPSLMKINWSKKADFNHFHEKFAQVDGFLLLLFDGALATSRFIGGAGLKNDIHTAGLTHDVLIHMYLSLNQIEKAINVSNAARQ
jgi:WD repeat-containing and planar cell polarity effector protein